MSLPKPPQQLVDYLPNGKTVCYDHHLRVCGICTVEFTYGESDEENPHSRFDDEEDSQGLVSGDDEDGMGDLDGDDDGEEERPERVFELSGSTARFLPQ